MPDRRRVAVYRSFEDENEAERRRLAAMTTEERCREFAELMTRYWGKAWTSTPIEKVATWETVDW